MDFRGLHKTKRPRTGKKMQTEKNKKMDHLTIRCVPRFNKGWILVEQIQTEITHV